ncbi:hypothetical protein C6568_04780 [Melaminivora suipulveris]|uniref:DUF4214 domain-containing protein n=2 Tax=Melaminivora suipulveris TaxID=2109913 RepID=A0A2R3QA40_9BURK|nr:hypothetical protein C6568_04780 [Melaminivora suipulveris]
MGPVGGAGTVFSFVRHFFHVADWQGPRRRWRCRASPRSTMSDSSPPLDLDTLLQRLREAAGDHAEPVAGEGCAPVRARPWAPPGARAAAPALPWGLLARAGAWRPYLLTDPEEFVQLAYHRLLGREPDSGGAAHWAQRLSQHAPRFELLAELAVSPEALAMQPEGARGRLRLARLLLLATHQRRLRIDWLARGILRRTEHWLTRRAQRSALGLVWQGARIQAQAQQEALAALRDQWHGLEQRQAAHERGQQQLSSQHEALQQTLAQGQTDWRQGVAALHARLQALAASAAPAQARPAAEAQAMAGASASAASAAGSAEVDAFLAALEAAFRGPEQALREQLAQDYLPRMQALRDELGDGPCLDLGCGRGVWLQVLRAAGFADVRGVDLNAAAVAEARAGGLQAAHGDALAWLRGQADGSVLAVTAFHLMEHLPFALRLALVGECARVLRPGGLLILETPNPENIWVATHTFHHDPTHSQPLTPDSLAFLATYCGLAVEAVPRLHPYPAEAGLPGDTPVVRRLNHMTCGGQDFAVLARKPA